MLKWMDVSTYVILFGLLASTILFDIGTLWILSLVVFVVAVFIGVVIFIAGVRKSYREFDLFNDESNPYTDLNTVENYQEEIEDSTQNTHKGIPYDSDKTNNLTESDMNMFNHEMNKINNSLTEIKRAMDVSESIKEIMNDEDRWKALEVFQASLVKSPERLTDVSEFAYTNLPYLAKLVKMHVKFENEEIIDNNMIEALEESADAINKLADLLVKDYIDFREKELNKLKSHISIVNQLVDNHG